MPTFGRVLVATLLLPAVLGGLVLWSLADRAEQRDQVPAAVVNLDRPVTKGKGDDKEVIAAGRLLAGGLTSPADGTSRLGWELTGAEEAERGLRDGGYHAVITIPEDFSRTLASVTGRHPRSARISVRTNDSSSPLVGETSRQVATVAAARLGHRVTATYLQGIFSRSGELKLKLGRASDAAGEVADGAGRLEDGAGRIGSGADRLADGAARLAGGAGQLDTGADRLAAGTARLDDGADRLVAGTARLDRGAHRLADGLGVLADRTDPLPRRTDRLADGAGRVADGTSAYARLLVAWKQACTSDPVVTAARPQLCATTVRAVGVRNENAERLREGARRLAEGVRTLADAMPELTGAVDRAAGGADRLADGAGRLATGTRRLEGGTDRLADGAARLSGGADRLAGGARTAGEGAELLADGTERLSDGSGRLSEGSERLASGLSEGAGQVLDADEDAAQVVADPVDTAAGNVNPAPDGATSLAPAVLALGTWLGAFVTYLVRRALPTRSLRAARPGWRLALSGWWPALLAGVVQAALLVLATVALGASYGSPVGVVALVLVCVAAFTAVNQALVAVLGRGWGWIVAIALTALQVVALGGLVPVETAPSSLQGLNAVLPVTRAVDGLARLTLGGAVGSPVADALVLVAWGAAGLLATTLAARRRQRVAVADVRREVAISR